MFNASYCITDRSTDGKINRVDASPRSEEFAQNKIRPLSTISANTATQTDTRIS